LLNWDGSIFQHYTRGGVIRNDHLNHEVVWLFSISEFSMFFAKLNLIIIKMIRRFLRYRRKA
ncbi:MAG: hypothetical protein VX662_05245, partial [SAR324 cluster bacterium]|nr:hypothetical protein [SAR324 cluster bacterium]